MKLTLLLVILMLCPTFAGQQSQDNLSDEQFEALLIKLLTPMQNGIEPEFEDETEMTWRCTLDGVIDRPDQVYKQSYFKGHITPPDSRWYRQPSPIKEGVVGLGYGKSTPVDLIISGRKVKTVRYEWTSAVKEIEIWSQAPQVEPYRNVRIQHTLGTENPILLHQQIDTNWWAVTDIVEKQIGERKYLCAEIKERRWTSGGYCITTSYVSPEIPGYIIESIKYYHFDDSRSFVMAEKLIIIRPPIKH